MRTKDEASEQRMARVVVGIACTLCPALGVYAGFQCVRGEAYAAAWTSFVLGFLVAGAPLIWLNSKILATNRQLTTHVQEILADHRAHPLHTHARGVPEPTRWR